MVKNKDFDSWNLKKKELHEKSTGRFYHVREIWWCSLGTNIGFEQDGKDTNFQRPVLVVKSFSKETCLFIPLTTSRKRNKYRLSIGQVANKESFAILSQIKVVDTKRFTDKIYTLDKEIFELIRKSIRDMF